MADIRRADPRWLAARRRLQDRYAEVSELPDASRIAYLRGPVKRFTEEDFVRLWERMAQDPSRPEEAQHSVYIHVPFCKSICSFCNYERLRPTAPGLLEAWLGRVLSTLRAVAPVLSPVTFEALYIGGGTPSTLPPRILSRLLEEVDERLQWHPHSARAFEFDPAIMNAEKLAVLRKHGFSSLSFGIQTLDAEVNQAHNRGAQSVEMVARRFEEMRDAGIETVSGDVLLGLKGTTPASILRDIEVLLERFSPSRLDVFMITPTHEYVKSHFGGDFDAFWSHLRPFQEEVPSELQAVCRRHGYQLTEGQGHRFQIRRVERMRRRPVASPKGSYQGQTGEMGRPVQILGLGPSARSSIYGVASLECRDPGASSLEEGPAWYRGHEVDRVQELIGFLAHRLRDTDRVERRLIHELFGSDVTELIPAAISGLIEEGLVRLSPEAVEMKRQSRQERTRALLWLVPERHLEHELARRAGLDLSLQGVLRLTEEIPHGTVLGEGLRFDGVDSRARIRLIGPQGGDFRLRIAPALDDGRSVRLVIELSTSIGPELRRVLTRALAGLSALLNHSHQRIRSQSMR
jgi:coproporphyrinogen III oxidase-like Fe-S oxidoreductase